MKYPAGFFVALLLLIPSCAFALTQSAALTHSSAQYLTAASSASLNFTSDFTVEGWYKFDVNNVEYTFISRGWDNGPAGHNYAFYYNGSGAVAEIISNGSSECSANTWTWTPTTGQWYHIAFTYSASGGSQIFYVDGVSQGTKTGCPSSVQSTSKVTAIGTLLGSTGVDEGISFGGNIALVRIWNVAESAGTILANKCTVFGSAQTNMVAEWSLDNVLTDASGNTNTLTQVNSASFTADVPSCLATVAATPDSSLFWFIKVAK